MKEPVPPQKAPLGSGCVDISTGQDARLAASNRYVEGMYRNPPPVAARGPRGGPSVVRIGRVTTAIGKATGATYGTGAVTLQVDTGSALADGTVTGVAVKNDHDKGFAVNALVKITPVLGSQWVIDVNSCTYLTS